MKQVQRGFTLIELVMVIVILGVLAAVAMPKFIDMKSDATTAVNAYDAGAVKEAAAARAACMTLPTASVAKCGAADGSDDVTR